MDKDKDEKRDLILKLTEGVEYLGRMFATEKMLYEQRGDHTRQFNYERQLSQKLSDLGRHYLNNKED